MSLCSRSQSASESTSQTSLRLSGRLRMSISRDDTNSTTFTLTYSWTHTSRASSRSDAMQYSVPTSSSGETASPTRRSTSRLSHHGSHDSSPTSSMQRCGASPFASSIARANGSITTSSQESTPTRCADSYYDIRPTSPAPHGTNTPTCFSSDRLLTSDSSPRLHHGSSTSETPLATGHSSPRSLACLSRSTLTRPTMRTPDSGPSTMPTMPARSPSLSMARTPRSTSSRRATRRGRQMSTRDSASAAITRFPSSFSATRSPLSPPRMAHRRSAPSTRRWRTEWRRPTDDTSSMYSITT